ncbi:MAG: hypothetical protein WBA12_11190 [Catalinimonas sp.]
MLIRIIKYALFALALGLGYYLYAAIRKPIVEKNRIDRIEGLVIEKLKLIREAEKAYFNRFNRYAGECDTLMQFIQNGQIVNVSRTETIIERAAHLGDSLVVKVDTVGMISVRDSLFREEELPVGVTLENLCIAPGSNGQRFVFYAGKVQKPGGYVLDVVEVSDPDPVDPARLRGPKEPLKFGSRTEVTTSGNWE